MLALTTNADARTLPYELFLLSEVTGLPDYPVEAAFAILTTLPLVLVYLLFERQVISGLTSGASEMNRSEGRPLIVDIHGHYVIAALLK